MHPQKMKFLDSYHAGKRTKVLKWDLGRELRLPFLVYTGVCGHCLRVWHCKCFPKCSDGIGFLLKVQEPRVSVERQQLFSRDQTQLSLRAQTPAHPTPSSNAHPCAKVLKSPWPKRKPRGNHLSFPGSGTMSGQISRRWRCHNHDWVSK